MSSVCSHQELEPRRDAATQKAEGETRVAINRNFNLQDKLTQFYGNTHCHSCYGF